MTDQDTELRVVDAAERQQFEITDDDRVLGHITYRRDGDVVRLVHTEVDPATQGQGVAGRLVRGTLDQLREQELSVQPDCKYVQRWLGKHPEYADLDHRQADAG